MIIIGRAINGISLNGDEYLLDSCGRVHKFESENHAREFLKAAGCLEEDLENFNFHDESVLNNENEKHVGG